MRWFDNLPNLKEKIMAEGIVVKACIEWLCAHRCDIIRNNSGAIKTEKGFWLRFGKKGSGDILALSPYGRWIEVECKTPSGDVQDHQADRQALVQSKGGIYIIARGSADALEQYKHDILAMPNWKANHA